MTKGSIPLYITIWPKPSVVFFFKSAVLICMDLQPGLNIQIYRFQSIRVKYQEPQIQK